jgi:hypothetical protein
MWATKMYLVLSRINVGWNSIQINFLVPINVSISEVDHHLLSCKADWNNILQNSRRAGYFTKILSFKPCYFVATESMAKSWFWFLSNEFISLTLVRYPWLTCFKRHVNCQVRILKCYILTLFWFAIVNEYNYKLEYVSIQKSSKDAKFGQCLYLWVPICYEQNWWAEQTWHDL